MQEKQDLDNIQYVKEYWKNRKAWKCGKCGKTYSFDEFLKLTINHHKPVCDCGYRFLLDRWRLHDYVKLTIDNKEVDLLVSTADLEFNHGIVKDLWYETMIFIKNEENEKNEANKENKETKEVEDLIEVDYERRYEGKEEAIADHNRILNLLKAGKYQILTLDNKKILYIN